MIQLKQKKGVSVMIGYILLVVFVIVISAIVYQWLRSYVPSDPLECSDEISLFIKGATFNSSQLNLTIKNTGKFNIAGYYIHSKNDSSQELPTIDLANYLNNSLYYGRPATNLSNLVLFIGLNEEKENSFEPGEQATHIFNVPASTGNITAIRVIPTIFQKEENRNRFLSCGNSRTEGLVGELFICTDSCLNLNYECGTKTICGASTNCGTCSGGNVCNGTGRCVAPEQCTDTCSSLGKECNSWNICGVSTNCGTCSSGNSCDSTGQCVITPTSCGDGNLDIGEGCDNGTGNTNTPCTPPYGGTCNYCSLSCESITIAGAHCGDTITNGNEVCDGNSRSCTINGYSGTQSCNTGCSEWNTCVPTQYCGDGSITNPPENCDDGNVLSGDGCSNSCLTESGWDCLGQPSVCALRVDSCPSYCFSLGYGGNPAGICKQNTNCPGGGIYQSGGDVYCTTEVGDFCCCQISLG